MQPALLCWINPIYIKYSAHCDAGAHTRKPALSWLPVWGFFVYAWQHGVAWQVPCQGPKKGLSDASLTILSMGRLMDRGEIPLIQPGRCNGCHHLPLGSRHISVKASHHTHHFDCFHSLFH